MISDFLSDRALDVHKEYLNTLKLRYSILEKSIPNIVGKNIYEINKMRIKDKAEVVELKSNIICHQIFFDSFGVENQSSEIIRKRYRTEASFLYELFNIACVGDGEFLVLYYSGNEVRFSICKPSVIGKIENPLLAVDLCEHSYFLDYGFDKDAYIKNALKFLNLGKIDKFLLCKD